MVKASDVRRDEASERVRDSEEQGLIEGPADALGRDDQSATTTNMTATVANAGAIPAAVCRRDREGVSCCRYADIDLAASAIVTTTENATGKTA